MPTLGGASGMTTTGGALGGLLGSRTIGVLAGDPSSNEAATTLLLDGNRSGVQVSASVGSAKNFVNLFGGGWGAGVGLSPIPRRARYSRPPLPIPTTRWCAHCAITGHRP